MTRSGRDDRRDVPVSFEKSSERHFPPRIRSGEKKKNKTLARSPFLVQVGTQGVVLGTWVESEP
jgi:hypothetical protein